MLVEVRAQDGTFAPRFDCSLEVPCPRRPLLSVAELSRSPSVGFVATDAGKDSRDGTNGTSPGAARRLNPPRDFHGDLGRKSVAPRPPERSDGYLGDGGPDRGREGEPRRVLARQMSGSRRGRREGAMDDFMLVR